MAFDVQSALASGYSPQEVAEFLANERNFDLSGALEAGYSYEDVISDMAKGGDGGRPEMSWGNVASQAVGNIPESGSRFVGDLWQAVTNPVETAQNIGNVIDGYEQKLVNKLPWEGARNLHRDVMGWEPEKKEQYADAVNQYFGDRYGSMEKFKQALATDPVGVAADASTLFTGGGALAKGAMVAGKTAGFGRVASGVGKLANISLEAGKILDPLNAAGRAVGGTAKAVGLTPERLYASAIKPSTTKLSSTERAAVVRTGLEEGIMPTQAGSDKLTKIAGGLSGEVERLVDARTMFEDMGYAPRTIDPEAIARGAIQKSWRTHGNAASPTRARNAINSAATDFLDSHGLANFSTRKAHDIKKATYKALNDAAYGEVKAPNVEMSKSLAHGAMEAIEANVPGVRPLNKKIGRLTKLREVIDPSAARIDNLNLISLTPANLLASGGGSGILKAGLMSLGTGAKAKAKTGIVLDAMRRSLPVTAARESAPLARAGRLYQAATDGKDLPETEILGLLQMLGLE